MRRTNLSVQVKVNTEERGNTNESLNYCSQDQVCPYLVKHIYEMKYMLSCHHFLCFHHVPLSVTQHFPSSPTTVHPAFPARIWTLTNLTSIITCLPLFTPMITSCMFVWCTLPISRHSGSDVQLSHLFSWSRASHISCIFNPFLNVSCCPLCSQCSSLSTMYSPVPVP